MCKGTERCCSKREGSPLRLRAPLEISVNGVTSAHACWVTGQASGAVPLVLSFMGLRRCPLLPSALQS